MNKENFLIFILLTIGILFRLYLTSHGNFIFNIDNARDMLDVREMLLLHKLRLVGPPAGGIEELYYGPLWYYMEGVIFALSGGSPYAQILLMIGLWFVGGWFLLKIALRWGIIALGIAGIFWIFADIYILATSYAFNPNPIILLMPAFIFFLEKMLLANKWRYVLITWALAGAFFNFEMALGAFIPIVILLSSLYANKKRILIKQILVGLVVYLLFLAPQIAFDLKHHFILTQSILDHLQRQSQTAPFNPLSKINNIFNNYSNSLNGLFMNLASLKWYSLGLSLFMFFKIYKSRINLSPLIVINLLLIFVPLVGFMLLPMKLTLWHIGAVSVALLLIMMFSIFEVSKYSYGKILVSIFVCFLFIAVWHSVSLDLIYKNENGDPSFFKTQIRAIDSVYQKAAGNDFRVYIYMPSVYDYPYQYLFWWYGARKYGYTPKDYAYLPGRPTYIVNKQFFNTTSERPDSGLTFLIKEPDDPQRLELWENNFRDLDKIESKSIYPLVVDVLK